VIVFFLVTLSFSSISGNQISNQIVKTSGRSEILYVGGSGPGNYTKIQDAIDNSTDGDTVFVYNGTYYGALDIGKSNITIIGENRDITIIDGNAFGNVVSIYADKVNISNFTIKNSGNDYYDAGILITSDFCLIGNNIILDNLCGIVLISSSNNMIIDNNIESNKAYGLRIRSYSNSNIIKNNLILNNGYDGIFFLWSSNYNQILCNIIHSNDGGISAYYSLNCDFIGNEITNSSSYGIRIKESREININNNIIYKSFYGGIHIKLSSDIKVYNNVISESYCDEFNGEGIGLRDVYNISLLQNSIVANVDGISFINASFCVIEQNNISNNSEVGIYFWSSNSRDNIFKKNSIFNNYHGMLIRFNNSDNIFYLNNFFNNLCNVERDEGNNYWDFERIGNYWDDYTGEDNDGDGIGDTPYHIPGGKNWDRYPLMEPWGGNHPPEAPIINGPTNGKPGVEYDYIFVTTDQDRDDVWYHICWGDKEIIYIYGPYPSGEEITLFYNWTDKGTYLITCWARDIYNTTSNTTMLEVTIPRNKAETNNMLLLRLLERFPILQR
jgi:parallel beta-helix repeat protein